MMAGDRRDDLREAGSVPGIWEDWWLAAAAGFLALAVIPLYRRLPERFPVHWNVAGRPDGWLAKPWGILLWPGLSLVVYLGFGFLPRLDPRRKNYADFAATYRFFRRTLSGFSLLVGAAVLLAGLGFAVHLGNLIRFLIGFLLAAWGNLLPRIGPNWFLGIRTPWTLEDPEVWRRTHRLGGRLFVLAGLILMLAAFFEGAVAAAGLGLALALILYTVPYSYLLYRRRKLR